MSNSSWSILQTLSEEIDGKQNDADRDQMCKAWLGLQEDDSLCERLALAYETGWKDRSSSRTFKATMGKASVVIEMAFYSVNKLQLFLLTLIALLAMPVAVLTGFFLRSFLFKNFFLIALCSGAITMLILEIGKRVIHNYIDPDKIMDALTKRGT